MGIGSKVKLCCLQHESTGAARPDSVCCICSEAHVVAALCRNEELGPNFFEANMGSEMPCTGRWAATLHWRKQHLSFNRAEGATALSSP